MTGWTDVVRRRFEGTAVEEPEQGDYPPVPEPTAGAWEEAIRHIVYHSGQIGLPRKVGASS